MKRFLMLIISCPVFAFSQNLTGTWEGNSGDEFLKLVVIQQGDQIFGYTYDEARNNTFCKATFSGTLKPSGQLIGKGGKMLQNSGGHILASYDLNYVKKSGVEYLRGSVGGKGLLLKILTMGIGTPATLKKVSNTVDTIPYMLEMLEKNKQQVVIKEKVEVKASTPETTTPEPVISKPEPPRQEIKPITAVVEQKKQRISKLVQNIYTDVDTVKLYLYDNGEIDNDTVTVFLDNVIVLDRYRISDKPKELYLPVKKDGKPHSVELFANNLGTIPPNTALIIIMAGKKRYELHASYDLETNAQIIVQYKK